MDEVCKGTSSGARPVAMKGARSPRAHTHVSCCAHPSHLWCSLRETPGSAAVWRRRSVPPLPHVQNMRPRVAAAQGCAAGRRRSLTRAPSPPQYFDFFCPGSVFFVFFPHRVLQLFQKATSCMLHIPGKLVPAVIDFLAAEGAWTVGSARGLALCDRCCSACAAARFLPAATLPFAGAVRFGRRACAAVRPRSNGSPRLASTAPARHGPLAAHSVTTCTRACVQSRGGCAWRRRGRERQAEGRRTRGPAGLQAVGVCAAEGLERVRAGRRRGRGRADAGAQGFARQTCRRVTPRPLPLPAAASSVSCCCTPKQQDSYACLATNSSGNRTVNRASNCDRNKTPLSGNRRPAAPFTR